MDIKRYREFIIVLLLWVTPVLAAVESGIVEQTLGRDFGILAGDTIEHRYRIQIPAEYRLATTSLPSSGELNYWLELRDLQYQQVAKNDQYRHYQLTYTYQTFYAPLDVRSLKIPAQIIQANADDKTININIPAWTFTMSPLKDIAPRGVGTSDTTETFMKPALRPEYLPVNQRQQQTVILGIVALTMLLLWAILKGYLFPKQRSAFQQALRTVRRYRKLSSSSAYAFKHALTAVHQALNDVAGQALFMHQLPTFLAKHPVYGAHQQALEDFFRLSANALYEDTRLRSQQDFDQLQKLCKALIHAEKIWPKTS